LPIGFRIARLPVLNRLARIITPRSIIERSLSQSVSNQKVVTPTEVDEYWELLRRPGNREATGKRFAQYAGRKEGAPVPAATRALPALILWGEEDKLIPVAAAKWFGATYADNVTHIYKGIGHLPMEEAPEQTVDDVLNWLARQKP
jgi:pimeloyl-ACP methyl ester carboxylesterase